MLSRRRGEPSKDVFSTSVISQPPAFHGIVKREEIANKTVLNGSLSRGYKHGKQRGFS